MDKIDKALKLALMAALNKNQGQTETDCPNNEVLAGYLAGGLSLTEISAIEKHISGCKICLQKLSIGLKADTLYKEGCLPSAVAQAVQKAQRIAAGPKKRGSKKNLWFIAALLAFILSFLFPRYFLQCLVATIVLGIKWIMESENMRTLILVFDSWRRHEHKHDDEISRRLSERGNIKMSK